MAAPSPPSTPSTELRPLHLFIPNLHCPSCVSHIESLLAPLVLSGALQQEPRISLLDRTVVLSLVANERNGDPSETEAGSTRVIGLLRDQGGFEVEVLNDGSSSGPQHDPSPLPSFLRKTFFSRLLPTRASGRPIAHELSVLPRFADPSSSVPADPLEERRRRHLENCQACAEEAVQREKSGVQSGPSALSAHTSGVRGRSEKGHFRPDSEEKEEYERPDIVLHESGRGKVVETTFVIEGMTCSACTSAISKLLDPLPGHVFHTIDLLSATARVKHDPDVLDAEGVKEAIEDAGYGAELVETVRLDDSSMSESERRSHGSISVAEEAKGTAPHPGGTLTEVTLSISGMTCSACSTAIKRNLLSAFSNRVGADGRPALGEVSIDPLGASGRVVFNKEEIGIEEIRECVEDSGYDVLGMEEKDLPIAGTAIENTRGNSDADKGKGKQMDGQTTRTVQIAVEGIFCINCVNKLNDHLIGLSNLSAPHIISFTPFGLSGTAHATSITYIPHSPLTIRDILKGLDDLAPEFEAKLVKVRGAGERGREIMRREREVLGWHFGIALLFAVPTFMIGIVGMVILPGSNAFAMYWMHPIWGAANRGTVALWPIATVVQFGVGRLFYERAWRSLRPHLRALLPRRGGRSAHLRTTWRSFFSFGSMDLLVVLSTSVSYFASVAMLAMDIVAGQEGMTRGTFFDSCVFLIMFILGGRVLEAFAKFKTTSAISELGQLRPAKALLLERSAEDSADASEPRSSADAEKASLYTSSPDVSVPGPSGQPREILVDSLEIGDLVLLRPGDMPPADGVLHTGSGAFDESSLTGESRPVAKVEGDVILSGTVNLSSPVIMRITTLGSETMVERIIRAVSDASGKKASIERLAESITGIFVPVIVYLAILVLCIWLGVTLTDSLPVSLLRGEIQTRSDKVFFAFEFAIAVLVIACPCGVGLAAPCAQAVGMGMAAKAGVLASGGGQAFQNTTMVTDVVFDKTGTLTQGVHAVTWSAVMEANAARLSLTISEVLSAVRLVELRSSHPLAQALVSFLSRHSELTTPEVVHAEERAGRGIVARITSGGCEIDLFIGNYRLMQEEGYVEPNPDLSQEALAKAAEGCSIVYAAGKPVGSNGDAVLLASWAISDRARPESKRVIEQLHAVGITTHMLTGDNPSAASVMAAALGISLDNVAAGVLPEAKGSFIQDLQAGRMGTPLTKGLRRIVLFIGDGLNDSVALASADVAVAMSHGSQAALTSADFVLLNSSLEALLEAMKISRKVYRRQKLNFAWALLFNCVCIPFAGGAFYALDRIRLSPVWSAVAMALSSTSVVLSSLAMRWGL